MYFFIYLFHHFNISKAGEETKFLKMIWQNNTKLKFTVPDPTEHNEGQLWPTSSN